ncbi:hypothetical protein [Actinocatenispora comari]|uniref:Uncharacterized protein n=1 Tax=Actinocatenispora comari TaxID=2807577 RepID=A0A8J4AJ63_9ACTN|nr:hypothetical protein [Actinocatenispora comari]GIL30702.1 hypothetical protein NUM_59560 [Actinocatenispora comari]
MPGFVTLLINIALSLPGVVVAGIGLVLSMTNRRRLGASSGAMLIAFVVLLVAALVGVGQMLFGVFGPQMTVRNHWSYSSLSLTLGGVGAVHMLISTAGWVVLLIAIFRRRDTATKPATQTWNQPPAAGQYGAAASLPGQQPGTATPQFGTGQQAGTAQPQFGAGQQAGAATPQFGTGQQPGTAHPRYGAAEAPGSPAGEQQPGGWTTPGGPSPY